MPLTTVQLGMQGTPQFYGFKNRIINGAMVIDQRNNGSVVTATASYPVDRFRVNYSYDGTVNVQRSTVAPAGFTNSIGFTVTTPDTSIGATQFYGFRQQIEGFNVADLGFGTANAQTVTLSFWVRSSITGTYGATLTNSPDSRLYPTSYTINSANTWEQKSITIAGDTTGTWLTDNGIGIQVQFYLALGSTYQGTTNAWTSSAIYGPSGMVNWTGTNGATFYITGVQLEVGVTATSFDYRPYGTELALCQRYYFQDSFLDSRTIAYGTTGSGFAFFSMPAPVTMRTVPSVGIIGTWSFRQGAADNNITSISNVYLSSNQISMRAPLTTNIGNGIAGNILTIGGGSNGYTVSAEL